MSRTPGPVLLALTTAWLASACGSAPNESEVGEPSSEITVPSVEAVDDPQPRLAVTYDGGVLVLDATDGEVLADEPTEGYARVSPAGESATSSWPRPARSAPSTSAAGPSTTATTPTTTPTTPC